WPVHRWRGRSFHVQVQSEHERYIVALNHRRGRRSRYQHPIRVDNTGGVERSYSCYAAEVAGKVLPCWDVSDYFCKVVTRGKREGQADSGGGKSPKAGLNLVRDGAIEWDDYFAKAFGVIRDKACDVRDGIGNCIDKVLSFRSNDTISENDGAQIRNSTME
ncbi:hypothetical protein EV356DRAFT_548872, partial [Viridothelium virens]